ncbi:TetR/AcrR family transcriptional regulator [Thalassotalea sp. Y01]|uniref:TetR/AcrR family transcriptional regulator n=1 Tax=Thalassotalea sp. Y01 TaxID=2729613 RepID=UPI00145C8029|nr:TetR/AcrR family transcriptional regulator [Thalassotalea sp. Y01]NMP17497.1 TetR/AcrR family transcriptional regulator [Thalassotalea sp. Y01]
MRKGYKKGETKLTDILKLTENILVRDGYAGLSMRKVAREMGITAGNLQYYFATKDELMSAVLDNILHAYMQQFDAIRNTNTIEAQFKELIQALFSDVYSEKAVKLFPELWAMASNDLLVKEKVSAMYETYRRMLSVLIKELNPQLSEEQAGNLSIYIQSSIEGHSLFIGVDKRWHKKAHDIISLATESFQQLILNQGKH